MSYYEIPVTVHRKVNGTSTKSVVNSSELVPGDIIEIPENVLMPCDVILISGSSVMNESMLTGESIPVIKNSLPSSNNKYSFKEDKQYTLFAGTKCIQVKNFKGQTTLGMVSLTGFTTVKGELIRTMLFPKPTNFKLYSDSFKFIGIFIIMALIGKTEFKPVVMFIGFFIDLSSWLHSNVEGLGEIIGIKASEIITITVPPALPTCCQVGIAIALARLLYVQNFTT